MQCDCDSRADQTQGEAQPTQTVFKKKREKEQDRNVPGENDERANLITGIGAAEVAGDSLLEQAKTAVNDQDAYKNGNTLREEGKRESLALGGHSYRSISFRSPERNQGTSYFYWLG